MGFRSSDLIFFLLAILIIQLSLSSTAQAQSRRTDSYRYHFCLGGNYTNSSTYRSNLDGLLSSLSSNAPGDRGYYNDTIGQSTDRVYGMFLCRGDATSQECRACVNASGEDLMMNRCFNKKEAIIWYDLCMLRYSDQYFFSILQQDPGQALVNTANYSDPDLFSRTLASLMDDLIDKVDNGNSSATPMYETGKKNLTMFQDFVYGQVQCTPDISQGRCQECLQETVKSIGSGYSGRQGGFFFRPSCYSRYENLPFFLEDTASTSRLPPSNNNTTPNAGSSGKSSSNVVAIVVPTIIGVLLLIAIFAFLVRRKIRTKPKTKFVDEDEIGSSDSLQFDLGTIRVATNNFSDENKLGEGGFGAVYKGELADGLEIAVKRLSKNSGQGSQEFKNEVVLLYKLQHRNLVRLLGFCLEGEENLLIYEYVPNRSLDKYIFDPNKRKYLDWERRYKIIGGIARGLLYLHEDSRLRIIHRDLKAGNILLDREMNAKISDFGMAKLFIIDQTQGNTSRIAGTFGYMAPEYALHGLFSVKSDVFSFGVLLLEIVSGQKVNNFQQSGSSSRDLLSYAWKHWREGTALDLMDPTLTDSALPSEVMRCIHIGLLCVQENVEDRPTMSSVVLMLSSYSLTLVSPSPPAFFSETRTNQDFPRRDWETDESTSSSNTYSSNRAFLVKTNATSNSIPYSANGASHV